MVKIAVVNQKGGVGKTLTVLNFAHGLALKGKRVLMIDLDSQAALTAIHIREPIRKSLFDLLQGKGRPADYIREIKANLFLLAADSRLARLESEQRKNKELLLKESLTGLKGYDFIILDCGPSLGILALAALTYSNYAIIPVKTDYLSLQGLIKINDLIEVVQEGPNPGLEVLGYLPTQFDKRRLLDREVISILKKKFKTFNPIRQNISLGESVSWGKSIFEYRKRSTGAADYNRLIKTILKELGS